MNCFEVGEVVSINMPYAINVLRRGGADQFIPKGTQFRVEAVPDWNPDEDDIFKSGGHDCYVLAPVSYDDDGLEDGKLFLPEVWLDEVES